MFGYYDNGVELSALVGKVVKEVRGLVKGSGEVLILTECGQEYMFHHAQNCCEHVDLDDFEGDASDIIGATVLSAEEVTSEDDGNNKPNECSVSWTWTFYKIETTKGGIWMRWLGESNGYYSESVDFVWVNMPDQES